MGFYRPEQWLASEMSDELFRVQCRVLDLGSDTKLSAKELRAALIELRGEILAFREAH